jgi:hypothetical protein
VLIGRWHIDSDHVRLLEWTVLVIIAKNAGTRWMLSKPGCKPLAINAFKQILKARRQLQTGKGTGEEAYNGMVDCFRKIIKHEGCA